METEHEKQRLRNLELVQLQEEAGRRAEQEKAAIAAQIEAERRATEKYKAEVRGAAVVCVWGCVWCGGGVGGGVGGLEGARKSSWACRVSKGGLCPAPSPACNAEKSFGAGRTPPPCSSISLWAVGQPPASWRSASRWRLGLAACSLPAVGLGARSTPALPVALGVDHAVPCPPLPLTPLVQLEKEVQRERALAEAQGRAEERRKNKDIYRE